MKKKILRINARKRKFEGSMNVMKFIREHCKEVVNTSLTGRKLTIRFYFLIFV